MIRFGIVLTTGILWTQATLANPLHHAPEAATPQDFIAVFRDLFGDNPGVRKGHARGVCASAEFVPSQAAKKRFSSPLFAQSSKVVARFSMGGGNPVADESAIAPRGMGLRFELPSGQFHNLAGLTTPMFAGKNPEQFLGLLRVSHAVKSGKAKPGDIQAYLQNNPEVAGQRQWLNDNLPAPTYTDASYYGVHTFFAQQNDGSQAKFRWQLKPKQGDKHLTKDALDKLPEAFLEERLKDDLAGEKSVQYDWVWTIGQAEDTNNNPSLLWPAQREQITVGTISITDAGSNLCDGHNFDPNSLAEGVSPSGDPVLAIRSPAYALSFVKRVNNR